MVRREDKTMKSIAEDLELTEEYLLSANEDYKGDDNKIARLALIEIPDADWRNLSAEVYCLTTHGNCLEQLAKYFYTDVDSIMELNPDIKDANQISSNYLIRVH